MEEVDALTSRRNGGNEAALRTWLQNAPPVGGKYSGGSRPKAGDRVEVYKQFILDCYEFGKFKSSGQTEQKVLQNNAEALPSHRSSVGHHSLPTRQTSNAFQSDNVSEWSFENQATPQTCDNSFHAFDFPSSLSVNEGTAGFATFPSQIKPPSVNTGTIFSDDIFNFTGTSSVILQSKPPPIVPTNCFDDPFGNDLLVPVSLSCASVKSRDFLSVDGPPSLGYAPSNSLDFQGNFVTTSTSTMTKSDTGSLFFASAPRSAPVGIMGQQGHYTSFPRGAPIGNMGQQQGPYAPGPAVNNNATMGTRIPTVTTMTTESVPYGRSGSYGYGAAPASSVSSAFSTIGNNSNTKQSTSFDFLEDALKQQLR